MHQILSSGLECSCGAKCEPKDKKRFLKRHPYICNQKLKDKDFNVKLAGEVKSVGVTQEEDVDLYRLEVIESSARGLTAWEVGFIKNIRSNVNSKGTKSLTPSMKKHLEQIYCERT